MESIGIDVHASKRRICMLTEQGEILERRVRTRPDPLAEVLGDRSRSRILIEAATEREWVASSASIRISSGSRAGAGGSRPAARPRRCGRTAGMPRS